MHPKNVGLLANNSFKPNLLRYTNNVAEKACHVIGSATQVGLTQAIARTLRLEPLQHVLLHAQRNGRFWRLRLEAATNDAAHHMTPREGVSEGVKGVSEGVSSLADLIRKQPGLRAPALAATLQTSPKNIERWLKQLKNSQLIEFRGAPKTGGYYPKAS